MPHQNLILSRGSHRSPDEGMCFMEAVAWLNGERHSANPACADGMLTQLMVGINDSLGDSDRQRLVPYLPRAIGTFTWPGASFEAEWLRRQRILARFVPTGGADFMDAGRAIATSLPIEEVLRIVDELLPQAKAPEVDPDLDPEAPPEPEPDPEVPDEVAAPEKPELVPA